ncbi:ATP-binding domain-containing protein [Herbidospora cretacea]|uniref:ATP-binding domain-containing protein n=1 Tax=Herbidospora cretacea TaxID=28444 RepID=UPI000AFDD522
MGTVDVTEARGLEFDTVVVVDPAAIEANRESGLRDLYVAMTRATKRLFVVTDPRP